MSERRTSGWDLILDDLRQVVREEIHNALNGRQHSASPNTSKPYFSVKEAAEFSRLAPSTIRLLMRKRRLPFNRVGRRVLIARDDLDRLLTSVHVTKPAEHF